jgi:hypothetical protein
MPSAQTGSRSMTGRRQSAEVMCLNQTTRDWHTDITEAPSRRLHSVQQVYESHVGQFRAPGGWKRRSPRW